MLENSNFLFVLERGQCFHVKEKQVPKANDDCFSFLKWFLSKNGLFYLTMNVVVKTLFFCTAFDLIFLRKIMVSNFELFYGNLSIEKYIEQFICTQQMANNKWSFVYIHRLQLTDAETQQTVHLNSSFYIPKHFQCFTAMYSQINVSQLSANLNSNYFEYTEILAVISVEQSSSAFLAQTLTTLNWLYIACSRCLPFLLLLPPNAQANTLKRAHFSAQLNSTFPLRAVVTFLSSHKTFHLNPVLGGCAQMRGLFEPKTSADFSLLIQPTITKCHLNNTQLTVSVNEEHPHCSLIFNQKMVDNRNKSAVTFGTYFTSESSLLEVLQRQFHFSSRLIHGEQIFDAQYNTSQGKWTGIVGQVYSGAAHFGFCGLSVMEHRQRLVDFSTATEIDAYAILTPHPPLRSKQWIAFEPFSTSVWALILASFTATLIAVDWLENASRRRRRRRRRRCHRHLTSTAEALYRILLKNCKIFKFFLF